MINFIVSIRDNWRPLGIGILFGAGVSNEFTIDIIFAIARLIFT